MYESKTRASQMNIKTTESEAYFRNISRMFKQKLDIPIIIVGGIRSRQIMDDILDRSDADLIALSRPLIREPDLPMKYKDGKNKADCISCNGCSKYYKLDKVRCTQI